MNCRGRHDHEADLTAIAIHRRCVLDRLSGAPVIESIQRESPIPVLVVQGPNEPA
jgi:nucleotide-binding universal stress UspA family protein